MGSSTGSFALFMQSSSLEASAEGLDAAVPNHSPQVAHTTILLTEPAQTSRPVPKAF